MCYKQLNLNNNYYPDLLWSYFFLNINKMCLENLKQKWVTLGFYLFRYKQCEREDINN